MTKTNQIPNFRPRSDHPRGRCRRPAATMEDISADSRRPSRGQRNPGCLMPRSRHQAPVFESYGYETRATGTVAGFPFAAPVLLTTWSIVPSPEIEPSRMSCNFTPGVPGAPKAWLEWVDGAALVKQ